MRVRLAAAVVAVMLTAAACGSSGGNPAAAGSTTSSASSQSATTPGTVSTAPGQGVTADSVKIGIVLIDFNCIKDYVDSIRTKQEETYKVFIDDINAKGGIGATKQHSGRRIVPVFKSYCPVGNATALQACTSLTDDEKVFAVLGTFYDPSGDAQACIASQHHVPLISDSLEQATIDKAPPGLMITPDITPDRRLRVLLSLLAHAPDVLHDKKVAVIADNSAKPRVESIVGPGLKRLGVTRGTDGFITVTGTDTTAAQSQLDSFIERWKTEHTNALMLVGSDVSSKQFVEKIRAALPQVALIADTTGVLSAGQDEQKAGKSPNPYAGVITAEGQTGLEHQKSAHGRYCRGIWEKATHQTMPSPNAVVPGPGGKREELYGEIEDACLFPTMLATIANRIGPNLNAENWANAVNHFGEILQTSTIYASVHSGKYDADDTYGLVQYDPTIPTLGDWKRLSPVENVGKA